jgi:hypothetical protein
MPNLLQVYNTVQDWAPFGLAQSPLALITRRCLSAHAAVLAQATGTGVTGHGLIPSFRASSTPLVLSPWLCSGVRPPWPHCSEKIDDQNERKPEKQS